MTPGPGLLDPAATAASLPHPPARPPTAGWSESLAYGAPGIALLHIERARTGAGRWETAHAWVAAATRTSVTANLSSGLYSGAPAVAFALHATGRPEYTPALSTLDTHITALTRRRVEQAHARMDRGELPAVREYDLISGLTGIGCYLLHRDSGGTAVRDVLGYLVRLTEPIQIDDETVPGWWTGHGPTDQPSPEFRGGHGNLGMAHGISGPLALLAQAMKRGVVVPGHAEAINRICAWTDRWRHSSRTRVWPPWITRDELRAGRPAQRGPSRPSWCYGTPGLARAQQLAGQATGDLARQRMAEAALLGCITDQRQLSLLTDTSLCHGWAGLLHTTWRAAADATTGELTARLPDPPARLSEVARGREAGLLDGATGVALALGIAGPNTPPVSQWDACLLTN